MRYKVVTVTEGGADFEEYSSPEKVPFDINPWFNTTPEQQKALRKEIREAQLGDEVQLDGCSVLFVLR